MNNIQLRNNLISQRNSIDSQIEDLSYQILKENYPHFMTRTFKKFNNLFILDDEFKIVGFQAKPFNEAFIVVASHEQKPFIQLLKEIGGQKIEVIDQNDDNQVIIEWNQ